MYNPQTFKRNNLVSWLRLAPALALLAGLFLPLSSHAAGTATLTLAPASGSYVVGSNLTITVSETSTDSINAVEADLVYDQSKLQFVPVPNVSGGVDASQSAFGLQVPNPGNGNGSVKISEASSTPYTGTQVVGSVTFKVLAAGTSPITFAGTSSIVRASDTVGVWNGASTGGTYTLTAAASGGGTTTTTPTTPTSSGSTKTTTTTTTKSGSATSTSTPTPTPTTTATAPVLTYAVAIMVVDSDGKPIMGAVVTIGPVSSTTNAAGVASFPTETAGTHSVSVTNRGKTKTENIAVAASGQLPAVQQFQLTLATGTSSRWLDYGLVLLLLIVVIGSGLGLSRLLANHHHQLAMTPGGATISAPPDPIAAIPPAGAAGSSQVFYPTPGSTPITIEDSSKKGPPDA